jgi:AcrR family transcriptional regulator
MSSPSLWRPLVGIAGLGAPSPTGNAVRAYRRCSAYLTLAYVFISTRSNALVNKFDTGVCSDVAGVKGETNGRLKSAARDLMLVSMSRKTAKARAAKPAAPAIVPTKRTSKRDAVLAEAAVQFNARGIAGTALADIATKLELTRAALYYYVDDRDDLVFRTYLRSCEITADDLAGAFEDGRNGLDRILAYVGRTLDAERAPAAVLSEVTYLSGSPRAIVEKAQKRNIDALQRFVSEGIADKSIRACDASLVAQTIVGLLSWAPLWPDWLGGTAQTARNFRKRVAAATRDLLSDGLASDPSAPIRCPINVETFRPRAANVFDKRDAQAMKMEQIAMTASRLFNRQGNPCGGSRSPT